MQKYNQHRRRKKNICTSKKEHIAECVLSAIILGWDEGYGTEGRRGETTKRPRNTTQARYSQVALSKIRLHYLPYFQSIFSWCGFVANFCFLPKYINPLFAVDVNNVGRCWQWHAPSLDWEQTARPSPISYLFRPVSHSPKIVF